MHTISITPLVPVERERFLRSNEVRILSAASNALASGQRDPSIQSALDAVLYAEDLHDRHTIAVTANRAASRNSVAEEHERYAQKSTQLKLRNLDQLAALVGI